jgi:hypothetical protein
VRPADTDAESYDVLVAAWRRMSVGERAELTQQLCLDVERLARADICALHPAFTEIEVSHELARRRYGRALADAAYAGRLPGG